MEQFIQQLLKDQGVPEDLDPKIRDQLVRDLTDRAVDMVNKRIIDAMDENTAVQFGKLIDEQPENLQAVQSFIDQNVPEKQTLTAAALLEFRTLYLGEKA